MIFIWNVSTEEKLITINFPDMVLSASFNWNGSRLVTTCKDRHTRIIDPRKGTILKVSSGFIRIILLVKNTFRFSVIERG